MESYMEHAKISVTDVEEAIRFFTTALPDFRIRHDSGPGPQRWVHLGTDTTYLCLTQMEAPGAGSFERRQPGYNHVGFVVEDAGALRVRMLAAGYREGFVPDPHPHRQRVYFIDNNGMEYEFVQYFSDDYSERNDYCL